MVFTFVYLKYIWPPLWNSYHFHPQEILSLWLRWFPLTWRWLPPQGSAALGCMFYIYLPGEGLSSSLVPGTIVPSSGLWGFMSAGGCMCYIYLPGGGLSSSLVPGTIVPSSGLWGFMSPGGCMCDILSRRGSLILLGPGGLWLPPRGSEASSPREALWVIYTYRVGVSHPPWSQGL